MQSRTVACLSLGLGYLILWSSVAMIPYGMHVASQTPQFDQFMDEFCRRNAPPGGGTNMSWAALAWPFLAWFCAMVCIVFTVGLYVVEAALSRHRDIGLMIAGVFCFGCSVGVLAGLAETWNSLLWDFGFLGAGYLLSAVGLGLGTLGVVGLSLDPERVRMQPIEDSSARTQTL